MDLEKNQFPKLKTKTMFQVLKILKEVITLEKEILSNIFDSKTGEFKTDDSLRLAFNIGELFSTLVDVEGNYSEVGNLLIKVISLLSGIKEEVIKELEFEAFTDLIKRLINFIKGQSFASFFTQGIMKSMIPESSGTEIKQKKTPKKTT